MDQACPARRNAAHLRSDNQAGLPSASAKPQIKTRNLLTQLGEWTA